MASRPAKRVRYTEDVPTSSFDRDYLEACIDDLEPISLKSILLSAVERDHEVGHLIHVEYQRLVQAEQARVLLFHHYSKAAWKAINVTYSSWKGSRQYHMASKVEAEIKRYIQIIRDGCAGHASFGTKENGLETLRKIGITIALSQGDVIANEVQKAFQRESTLEETIKEIIESMTEDEKEDLRWGGNPEGEWFEKLVELEKLAASRCLFEGLEDVVSLLRGDEHDNDEEAEDSESADQDAPEEVEGEDSDDNDRAASH